MSGKRLPPGEHSPPGSGGSPGRPEESGHAGESQHGRDRIDVARWRAEFPLLDEGVYLRNNAMGATPRRAIARLYAYGESILVQGDDVWASWYPLVLGAGDRVGKLIGAPPGTVTTGGSVTGFVHQVASCLTFPPERPKVVLSELDFPSVRYAWQAWTRYGAEPTIVPSRDGGITLDDQTLLAAIDERTALVVLSLPSYGSSFVPDVPAVVARAREVGALVLVDAFQGFGILPIDVIALGVDFLVSGCRKFALGSAETAFLYVRQDLVETLTPAMVGWMGHEDPFGFAPEFRYAEGARRFQVGTPLVLPLYLAEAGWAVLEEVGIGAIRDRSLTLTDRIIRHADALGIPLGTPRDPARRGGVMTLRPTEGAECAQELNARRFRCSFRPGAGLRVAPHFYNTEDEVDRFMEALAGLVAGALPQGC